ncbi:MAG: hypothetical protein D6767_09585 [Candidatus Hydrogenedentota bacterium]|nr:MAG: hypothetical protein D6767_09585 [Candidatus Hydrogenedentota bacterium]
MTLINVGKNTVYCWRDSENTWNEVSCLPLTLSSLREARLRIRKACNQNNLDEVSAYEIELLAEELLSNALYATYTKNKEEFVVLRWKLNSSQFMIMILDYGGGIPKENILSPKENTNLKPQEGCLPDGQKNIIKKFTRAGRGLSIIGGIAEKVDVLYHYPDGEFGCERQDKVAGSVVIARYRVKNCRSSKKSLNCLAN